MKLKVYKLGDLIEEIDRRNDALAYDIAYVRGISNAKQITKTKADVDATVINKFYVIMPDEFIYNPRTTRMGEKVGLGYNNTETPLLFTFNNIAFRVKQSARHLLLSEYLYMYYSRSEFDRYAMIHSWGSATELFSFDEMCNIDIKLPDLPIQKKYVDIYKAMVANQEAYERGLEDLKLVCDGYIEDLRRKVPCKKIGSYIELVETRNDDLRYGIDDVRGVSIDKRFIDTKADMKDVDLTPYYVIAPNEFAYVTVTSRNGQKISIALNETNDSYICSSSYVVFRSKDERVLLPRYLMLFFSRPEFNRYARYNSWGSARETFDWEEMRKVKIPIPDIGVQKAIAEVFTVYNMRKKINEQLKRQIRDICPILLKGSLEEGV